ncbi:hypothetical protein BH23CHL7_BH23CHL7_22010 [soil metagenome]
MGGLPLVFGVGIWRQGRRAATGPLTADPSGRPIPYPRWLLAVAGVAVLAGVGLAVWLFGVLAG